MEGDQELRALERHIRGLAVGAPPPWEVPVDETRRAREDGRSIFGALERSSRATDERISTSRGEVGIRVIRPESTPMGVYVHIHGGGWVFGATHHQDRRLVDLADATAQTVVSIDYRLAPEAPYPSGPDDCEAAAVAIIEQAKERFGASRLTFGGESAGAHLTAVTLLRLRDRHGWTACRAANLLYGVYDLRGTPSVHRAGMEPLVLTGPALLWMIDRFLPPGTDRTDPDVSPLMAEVHDLPPAIFTVGTADPVLDDTVLMHRRWRDAGIEAELQCHEGAPHAFDAFEWSIGQAALDGINRFLRDRLAAG